MSILKQGSDLYFLYTFLKRLTTPFEETKAFELGIIDENGKVLRKRRTLTTQEEKDSYTLMDTMVFNMKKIMAKVPFGKSKLFSYAASLFLLKEQTNKYKYLINESKLEDDLTSFYNSLTEEEKTEIQTIIKKAKAKSDLAKDDKVKEKEKEKDDAVKDADSFLKSVKPEGPEEEEPPSDDESPEDEEKPEDEEEPEKDDDEEEEEDEEEEQEEEVMANLKDEAPANSTGGIAGAGDDSSTVPVSKNAQKKIRKKNRVANIMKLRREASWNQLIKK